MNIIKVDVICFELLEFLLEIWNKELIKRVSSWAILFGLLFGRAHMLVPLNPNNACWQRKEGIENHTGVAPLNFKCLNCGEITKKRPEKTSQAFLGHSLWSTKITIPLSLYLTKLNSSSWGWQEAPLHAYLTNRRKCQKISWYDIKCLPASFFIGSQNSWQNQISESFRYFDAYLSSLFFSQGSTQVLLATPIRIIIRWKVVLKTSRLLLTHSRFQVLLK